MRDPGGLQPSPKAAPFVFVIVKIPVIQMLAIALGLVMIAVELPLPLLKPTAVYRSIAIRIVMLVFQTVLCILFYQGTNAALWSFIAAVCYIRSLMLRETIEEPKENRRMAGGA